MITELQFKIAMSKGSKQYSNTSRPLIALFQYITYLFQSNLPTIDYTVEFTSCFAVNY